MQAKSENHNLLLKEEIKRTKNLIKQMQVEAMKEYLKQEDFKLENEMSFARNLFWKRVRRFQEGNKK